MKRATLKVTIGLVAVAIAMALTTTVPAAHAGTPTAAVFRNDRRVTPAVSTASEKFALPISFCSAVSVMGHLRAILDFGF